MSCLNKSGCRMRSQLKSNMKREKLSLTVFGLVRRLVDRYVPDDKSLSKRKSWFQVPGICRNALVKHKTFEVMQYMFYILVV